MADARSPVANDDLDRAILRSEVFRVRGLVAFMVLGIVVALGRSLVFDVAGDRVPLFGVPLLTGSIGLVYELTVLWWFERAWRRGRMPTRAIWVGNTLGDSMLPTIGMLIAWWQGAVTPTSAAITPIMLMYTVFMVFSTLRLRPGLAALTGVSCALQHAAILFAIDYAHDDVLQPLAAPREQIYSFPLGLLLVGVAATFVTARLRRHAEVAIATERRRNALEFELDTASEIQKSLLPRTRPSLAKWAIGSWSRPAEATGGDYYDWIERDDGTTDVLLADVSGHGLGPALLMAFCRATGRTALLASDDLRESIETLNVALSAEIPDNRFVTLAAARLDAGGGRLDLLSAGHGPIQVVRRSADGDGWRIEERAADAPPLGLAHGLAFPEPAHIELAPGEMLVLMTDGFTDWDEPGGARFGDDRVRHSLARAAAGHDDPDAVIAALVHDVETFANGTPQPDDLTVLVIRALA